MMKQRKIKTNKKMVEASAWVLVLHNLRKTEEIFVGARGT